MTLYVLLIIGIILLFASIILFNIRYKIYKNGTRVIGKVIKIEKIEQALMNEFNQLSFVTFYRPVIEFITDNGEKKVFTYEIIDGKDYNVGDDVKIVYDKKKRNKFYIDSKIELFILPTILVTLSLVFLILSVIICLHN
ncbi:DUF3592 domain-containing protein [Clostridium sp.]|uniref:DUF3592 domain-containing protein n=1 Tax=Clostridium sp. TaxID=1506 RepID=UPI002A909197|nr:DUF3592 domain-containing protein [Clostridium sp.]MDY6012808.1 DUF3592 domain-containing protein [Clostridium sp.]